MPKKMIRDRNDMYDVRVGWSEAGGVQVGVESRDGRPLVQEDALASPAPTGGGGSAFPSVWGTLDRTGVNELVRTLRKARDQAYGADA